MKTLHYSIIAILAFIIIMITIIEFPLYRGPSGIITGSKLYQDDMIGNNVTISKTISPHDLPVSTEIGLLFNGTQHGNTFYVKQGQNVTLVVSVTSNPTNLPITLYAEPHIGFTSKNGLDFKFSSTHVTTPGTSLLHILVGKDATPNAYRTTVFATTEGGPGSMSMGYGIGITVELQNNTANQNETVVNQVSNNSAIQIQNTKIHDPLEENNGSLSGSVSSYVYGGPLGSMTNRSSNYAVDVYATDGITLVGKTLSDDNAHYFMHIPAGNYTIYTYNELKQKYNISILAGKNTVFNITSSIHVP